MCRKSLQPFSALIPPLWAYIAQSDLWVSHPTISVLYVGTTFKNHPDITSESIRNAEGKFNGSMIWSSHVLVGLLCISSTIRFPMPARHSLGQSRFLEDHDAPGEGPDRVTFSFDFRKIRLPSSLLKIEKARKEKSYDYADQDNPPPKDNFSNDSHAGMLR